MRQFYFVREEVKRSMESLVKGRLKSERKSLITVGSGMSMWVQHSLRQDIARRVRGTSAVEKTVDAVGQQVQNGKTAA